MPNCNSCGAPIRWARTPAGAEIPVDVENVGQNGNLILLAGTRSSAEVFAVSTGALGNATLADLKTMGLRTFQSHFASCPNAEGHRKGATS